jgi:hypothetical protein
MASRDERRGDAQPILHKRIDSKCRVSARAA